MFNTRVARINPELCGRNLMYGLLLLCGDVSENPGPVKDLWICMINLSNITRKPLNAKSVSSGIMSNACPLLQSNLKTSANTSSLFASVKATIITAFTSY